jgi:hypothetical protein
MGIRGQDFQHLTGVVLPVRGQVQVAAGLEPAGQQFDEGGLDQAALVMALLVPGVGKEDMDAVQAGFGQHVLEHFDGIMLDDAQGWRDPVRRCA